MQPKDKFRALYEEYDSLGEFSKAEYNLRKTFIAQNEEEEIEMPYKDMWKDFTSLYLRHSHFKKAELIAMRRIGEALEQSQIL